MHYLYSSNPCLSPPPPPLPSPPLSFPLPSPLSPPLPPPLSPPPSSPPSRIARVGGGVSQSARLASVRSRLLLPLGMWTGSGHTPVIGGVCVDRERGIYRERMWDGLGPPSFSGTIGYVPLPPPPPPPGGVGGVGWMGGGGGDSGFGREMAYHTMLYMMCERSFGRECGAGLISIPYCATTRICSSEPIRL